MLDDSKYLALAIEEARVGAAEGGVPIGAVLVDNITGQVLGRGHNQRVQRKSVVLHAEMDALENAGRLPGAAYKDTTMYTTLSPCDMCSGACLLYGVGRVVLGENRTFLGGEEQLKARGVDVINVNNDECYALMEQFIAKSPELWNEDIGV